MKRKLSILAFSLLMVALFTLQSSQADITKGNEVHMDGNADWSAWTGGGGVPRKCKPCHAPWNLSTTQDPTVWSDWADADGFVINDPARTRDNCVGCHRYGYPDMSTNIDPNIPTMVDNSVHGSLEAKCLSCHTIYHSAHTTIRSETINGTVYTGCDSGCHKIAANLDDKAANDAVTDDDRYFARFYVINSTVIPAYKPVPPSSTTPVTTSFNPSSYNLLKGTFSGGSISNLQSNDGSYLTVQAAATGSQTVLPIQPSVKDAYVDERNPTVNDGSNTNIGTYSRSGRVWRTFISFDVSSIPNGVSIASATLSLYVNTGAGTGRTIAAYNVTGSWTEAGITWNTKPNVSLAATTSSNVPASNGWMNWTITSLVSGWYSGGTNNGVMIRDANEGIGADTVLFYSREYSVDTALRPRLIVTYVNVSGYSAVIELNGASASGDFSELVWSVDSAITTGSVPVKLQIYNYSAAGYPTSGIGYWSYTSSATPNTDQSFTDTISTNPGYFKDSSGNWKIRINATLGSPTQFNLKVDWVEYKPTYYPPVETFVRKLYNQSVGPPFGESVRTIYLLYWDPWNLDPSLIASTERYKICFNCHFITTNPAEAAIVTSVSERQYIPIPNEVFSFISDPHSIKPLGEFDLSGEDTTVEVESNAPVLPGYIWVAFIVAAVFVMLVGIKR